MAHAENSIRIDRPAPPPSSCTQHTADWMVGCLFIQSEHWIATYIFICVPSLDTWRRLGMLQRPLYRALPEHGSRTHLWCVFDCTHLDSLRVRAWNKVCWWNGCCSKVNLKCLDHHLIAGWAISYKSHLLYVNCCWSVIWQHLKLQGYIPWSLLCRLTRFPRNFSLISG